MFVRGDKIRIISTTSSYTGKTGTVEDIRYPFGLHCQYIIRFDEPFYEYGYKVETTFFYDFENAIELRKD